MTDPTHLIELEGKRKELLRDLELVERQITDAANEVFRIRVHETHVLQRYVNGEYIVKSFGHHWWVDANGELIERADADDVLTLEALVACDILGKIKIDIT